MSTPSLFWPHQLQFCPASSSKSTGKKLEPQKEGLTPPPTSPTKGLEEGSQAGELLCQPQAAWQPSCHLKTLCEFAFP